MNELKQKFGIITFKVEGFRRLFRIWRYCESEADAREQAVEYANRRHDGAVVSEVVFEEQHR